LGDAKFPLRLQALKTPMELFLKTKKGSRNRDLHMAQTYDQFKGK
jgi:hypothetical protein